ncbi:hypothetical protein C6Y14_43220 [Streptomyces dioscori]|uniref:Uncharacterized protein n=1 Tax=Streptomyces dioscori TaxID=2109333 RepID=A0A2P8PTF1_9ACTN|nr:hypothetical protein C6Y14_43220 [Streptomyces dioscori]
MTWQRLIFPGAPLQRASGSVPASSRRSSLTGASCLQTKVSARTWCRDASKRYQPSWVQLLYFLPSWSFAAATTNVLFPPGRAAGAACAAGADEAVSGDRTASRASKESQRKERKNNERCAGDEGVTSQSIGRSAGTSGQHSAVVTRRTRS